MILFRPSRFEVALKANGFCFDNGQTLNWGVHVKAKVFKPLRKWVELRILIRLISYVSVDH